MNIFVVNIISRGRFLKWHMIEYLFKRLFLSLSHFDMFSNLQGCDIVLFYARKDHLPFVGCKKLSLLKEVGIDNRFYMFQCLWVSVVIWFLILCNATAVKAKLSLGISGLLICFPVLKKVVHYAFGKFLSLFLVFVLPHVTYCIWCCYCSWSHLFTFCTCSWSCIWCSLLHLIFVLDPIMAPQVTFQDQDLVAKGCIWKSESVKPGTNV